MLSIASIRARRTMISRSIDIAARPGRAHREASRRDLNGELRPEKYPAKGLPTCDRGLRRMSRPRPLRDET